VSSNVSKASTSAAAEIAAMIQNSGRQASASAWRPPTSGPRVTAPKMHMLMITAVERNFSTPKPSASGGTAAIRSRLVQMPCSTWPATNIVEFCAAAARIEPTTSSATYTSIIRRWRSSWANCTATTVPTA
jgi:hypothetical protein